MKAIRWASSLKSTLRRGIFPHEISFFLHLPWRYLVLSPRKLVARLALSQTSRVLEVGAGSGFYSVAVARAVPDGHLELLDLQPEMLRKAQRKLKAEGLTNVGYTLADAACLPFPDASFDALFLVAVFGEVSDRRAFLREARRVLKPTGILSISEHLPDPDFSRLGRLKTLVETEGFRLLSRHGLPWSYTANFTTSAQVFHRELAGFRRPVRVD